MCDQIFPIQEKISEYVDRNVQTTTIFDCLICLNDNLMIVQGVTDLMDMFEQKNVHNMVGNNFSIMGKEVTCNVPSQEQ